MTRHLIIWSILVGVAFGITLATGSIYHPAGHGYGIPLPWKIVVVNCPDCPVSLNSPPPSFTYDWYAFAIDVMFYISAGYGVILVYTKGDRKPTTPPFFRLEAMLAIVFTTFLIIATLSLYLFGI